MPDHDATLAHWLIQAPGAHLVWSEWLLWAIHLRPIEGARPAHKTFATATHEILCIALDPGSPADPDRLEGSARPLTPGEWGVQFDGTTDAQAVQTAEACVHAIMSGQVSPDADWRRYWQGAIPTTARCIATGKHLRS